MIRKYNPCLYKIGRSFGYNHQDVEDLMQETFINAYKHLANLKQKAYFKTWITRIMLNECYRKSCKINSRRKIEVDLFSSGKVMPVFVSYSVNDTAKNIWNRELKCVINTAIKHIPLNYRTVFSLRALKGMSVYETAAALNITETNVKVRLNRAKAMLRKEVRKTYSFQEISSFT